MPHSSAPDGTLLKTGPVLVGIVVNWWLWGILIMQYITYLNSDQAKRDRPALRGVVYSLFFLDAAQSILAMVDAFHWFVYNFGNADALSDLSMAGIDGPFLDGIIAFMVQLVYCWRIWVLSRRRLVLPMIIALLGLVSCVGGAIRGIQGVTVKVASKLGGNFDFAVILWNAAGAAADILIASSMAYLLFTFSVRNTRRGLLRYIRLIAVFILETNMLTKPIGPKFTSLNLMMGYPLGKLYSNCFMVLLNQRSTCQAGSIYAEGTTISSMVFRVEDCHSDESTMLRGSSPLVFTSRPLEVHVGSVMSDYDAGRRQVKSVQS
ncbi:hypothetical protein D9756_007312 [Leucocoprinus leucothites]|uniref:DUF6534 domain-containing protein n=1 Tax=Leucocoprinus leucothites TaxID=201217 RepID=A0A8H5D5U2_9AGAR|nr:hypothetical protein D9756_007312 [Leucoagaricus leucothites]